MSKPHARQRNGALCMFRRQPWDPRRAYGRSQTRPNATIATRAEINRCAMRSSSQAEWFLEPYTLAVPACDHDVGAACDLTSLCMQKGFQRHESYIDGCGRRRHGIAWMRLC